MCIRDRICFWVVVSLKSRIGIDDSLDVFGIHGVGGIVGAVLTGVFAAPSLGGAGIYDYAAGGPGAFDMGHQVYVQALGAVICVIWSGVVSFLAIHLVRMTIGLRVGATDERQGLDLTTHGENAYN